MYNPYRVVREFEEMIAEYAGSKYAVAVDSCTNAIFLSCVYTDVFENRTWIPRYTYPSVANSIMHAGGDVGFDDIEWSGVYQLFPHDIFDGALRFQKGMYRGGFHCLSFHNKKHLNIGRGGMILTNNKKAYKWFKKARFDGRSEKPLEEDKLDMIGWNCYMTPDQAVRGIQIFEVIKDKRLEDIAWRTQGYPDLSKLKIYK